MDQKAKDILEQYKVKIENDIFEELDILGFLIFIREYIKQDKSIVYVNDFCDLIAHRNRDRGLVIKSVSSAIDSKYAMFPGTKKLANVSHIIYEDLKANLETVLQMFGIAYTDQVILEIIICIFSLANCTKYDDKQGHAGIVYLFQNSNGQLWLVIESGITEKLMYSFAGTPPIENMKREKAELMYYPVQAVRKNGVLVLKR